MPVLRDHQRVATGDHSDADIHVEYGKGIEGEVDGFEVAKMDAREKARFLTIRPGEVKIDNEGV